MWNIHYQRWIIDDGEPERESGEHFEWPLMSFFSVEPLTAAATPARSASELDDYGYEIAAEILHLSANAVAIDFGLIAFGYRNSVPGECQVGDYVTGTIKLFFVHYCWPSLPDRILESMNHTWRLNGIWADTTPYRRLLENSRAFVRDSENATYERTNSTREKKARSYVLQCTLLAE
jgi:hypothetical protein